MRLGKTIRSGAWLALVLGGCSAAVAGDDGEDGNDAGVAEDHPIADDDSDPTDPVTPSPAPEPSAAPLACPASYTVTIVGSTSRYRVITQCKPFAAQHADCGNDAPSGTHLVAIDDPGELAELHVRAHALPSQPPQGSFYVGAIQHPAAQATLGGWLTFTGAALTGGLWATGQPDDRDHVENRVEQRAVVHASGKLHDVSGAQGYGAICECDGLAVAPAVTSAL